jgi:hypothetical protein
MLAKRAKRDGKHVHNERGRGTQHAGRLRLDAILWMSILQRTVEAKADHCPPGEGKGRYAPCRSCKREKLLGDQLCPGIPNILRPQQPIPKPTGELGMSNSSYCLPPRQSRFCGKSKVCLSSLVDRRWGCDKIILAIGNLQGSIGVSDMHGSKTAIRKGGVSLSGPFSTRPTSRPIPFRFQGRKWSVPASVPGREVARKSLGDVR